MKELYRENPVEVFDETQIKSYLKTVGRVDAVLFPLKEHIDQPIQLLLGVGPGTVQKAFHPVLAGEKIKELELYSPETSMLSVVLWELGLIGLCVLLGFMYLSWRDALFLSQFDGLEGVVALWWLAVPLMGVFMLAYKNLLSFSFIGYFGMYFAGYVAAGSYRRRLMMGSG